MRYLSDEWKREQWRSFEEEQIAGDGSDCGGWGWDPPCGGCARCMRDQFSYYLHEEEKQARVFLDAGFDVAPFSMVNINFSGDYHDSWRCYCAEERAIGPYPWEKVS